MMTRAGGIAMLMACVAACLLAAEARNAAPIPTGVQTAESARSAKGVRNAEGARNAEVARNAKATWNPKAAAAYLDERESWWMSWPRAAHDHDTFCVSCHTVLPYALSRPALHSALGEQSVSANEQKLIENVTKRVRLWQEVEPWYSDEKVGVHKTRESRGTEAILDALVLARHDAETGTLSADTKLALDNLWALQLQTGDEKGSWHWIQFDNEPWEAFDSQYYGTALAAIAIGTAPQDYRSQAEIQNNIEMLRKYLAVRASRQSPFNRVMLLWASAKLPGLLGPEERQSIIREILGTQQADDGWSLTSLVGPWKRHDGTPLETASDGYATGLAVYALEQAGISRTNVQLNQGLAWLANNQDKSDGRWLAYSMNKKRDASSDAGPFMNDAATAYAVLALTQAK
jgi:squalene-hopene/tetraprenyl-beta-curcumene cyclase